MLTLLVLTSKNLAGPDGGQSSPSLRKTKKVHEHPNTFTFLGSYTLILTQYGILWHTLSQLESNWNPHTLTLSFIHALTFSCSHTLHVLKLYLLSLTGLKNNLWHVGYWGSFSCLTFTFSHSHTHLGPKLALYG